MMDSDLELLGRYVERDDREALNALFTRHYPAVYHTILRLVPQEAVARDLAQETFLKALGAARSYQATGKFRNWVLAIAVNQVRQHWRAPRPPALRPELEVLLADVRQASPDEAVGRREVERALEAALDELPEELKVPLVLHFYERLSLAEVAEILDLTKSVVQKRCESGLQKLRKRFLKAGKAALLAALVSAFPGMDPALASMLNASPRGAGLLSALAFVAAKPAAIVLLAVIAFTAAVAVRAGRREPEIPASPQSPSIASGRSSAPATPAEVDPTPEPPPVESIRSRGPGTIVGSIHRLGDYRPVRRASIRVVPQSRAFENVSWSGDDGTFLCRELPVGGSYALLVTSPGMGYVEVPNVFLSADGPAANVGALLVQRGGILRGIVQDRTGTPVEGAVVRAGNNGWEAAPDAGNVTSIAVGLSARTDATGRFELGPIAPGYHDLRVDKEGYGRKDIPGHRVSGDGPELEVTLSPGGLVAGRVVDEEERPLPGARVNLLLFDRYQILGQRHLREVSFPAVKSDADGRFRFECLPDFGGAPQLLVSAPGFLSAQVPSAGSETKVVLRRNQGACVLSVQVMDAATGEPIAVDPGRLFLTPPVERGWRSGGKPGPGGTVVFEGVPTGPYVLRSGVPGYSAPNLDVQLAPPAVSVVYKIGRFPESHRFLVHGVVTDADTRLPISGARLRYRENEEAVTDSDGRYSFPELGQEPGLTYMEALAVAAVGYHALSVNLTTPKEGRTVRLDVALEKAEKALEVAGVVVDPHGRGVPGCEVTLHAGGSPTSEDFRGRTDRDGRFRFANLRPDALGRKVGFRVSHPAYPTRVLREPRERVAAGVRLELREGGALSGQVVDDRGEPVPLAIVYASREDDDGDLFDPFSQFAHLGGDTRVASVRCDAQGRFSFPPLPREKLLILPSSPDHSVPRNLYPHAYVATPAEGRSVTLRLHRGPYKK